MTLRSELFVDFAPSETMFLTAPIGDANHFYTGGRRTMDIWIHDRATGARIGTFMNLPNTTGLQDGLLSMAFHPNHATNGLFYTYTFRTDDRFVRVTEWKRSETDPLVADPDYKRQILEVPNPSNSHNGGWLGFSPIDGYLYTTIGDGGANQGPNNGLPSQDPFDLHGKLLRVDVNADDFPADETKNYSIPATNPFDGTSGLPEIFALGLRHTFRAGFDRVTGDLYLGDVGGAAFEEINFIPAGTGGGQNFGWRALEGSQDNPQYDDPAPPGAIDPIYEYPNVQGASVTGGVVYRGSQIPELQGTYLFGDFVDDEFFSFEYDGANLTNFKDRTPELFPNGFGGLVAYGEDGLGELYVVDFLNSDIHRILKASIPGDFDDDGDVDLDDFGVFVKSFQNSPESGPPYALGDFDEDGDVDVDDFSIFVDSFQSFPSHAVAAPEPTACALLTVVGLLAGFRRR